MKQLLLFSFLLISFAGFSQATKSMRDYTPRAAQLGDTIFTNRNTTGTTTLLQLKGLYFAGTTLQYMRGDGSLATFPTDNAGFSNGAGYITSSALSPYATISSLNSYLLKSDTTAMLVPYLRSNVAAVTYATLSALATTNTTVSGKQNTITLTTNNTSGAATFNATTGALNIPNYATGGGGSTTLTDNLTTSTTGTALDAHQGFVLKGLVDGNTTNKADKTGTTDIEITDATKGVILKSANGTRFRLTVNNDGSITTTSL